MRLHFAEPEEIAPGQRVFDVMIQGRPVVKDFDIVKEAGRPRTVVVKELGDVQPGTELTIAFIPKQGEPLICGIEVVAEVSPGPN